MESRIPVHRLSCESKSLLWTKMLQTWIWEISSFKVDTQDLVSPIQDPTECDTWSQLLLNSQAEVLNNGQKDLFAEHYNSDLWPSGFKYYDFRNLIRGLCELLNSWVMSQKLFYCSQSAWHWTTKICPTEWLWQIWRNSFEAFLTYCAPKNRQTTWKFRPQLSVVHKNSSRLLGDRVFHYLSSISWIQ